MWAALLAVCLALVDRINTEETLTTTSTRTTVRIHRDRGTFQRQCTYSGTIPPFYIQWLRNGSVIKQEDEGVLTSTLMISPVEYQHQGTYSCRVVNGRSIWLDAPAGSLKVFNAGTVFYAPRVQRVSEGSSTRVICRSSIPTTYVYWTIPSGSSASLSGYINSAQETDEGLYGCHIIDRRGSLLHTIEIRLIVNLPGYCEDLTIENGEVILSNGSQGVSMAFYSCHEFYYLSGPTSRTCAPTNMWSGAEPECKPVECPAQVVHHGQVQLSNGTRGGSVATYSCDQYFNLAGVDTRVCQQDQQWSDVQPTCEPVVCPSLAITNGKIYFTNQTYGGSVAAFQCDSLYQLNGTTSIICTENGTWNSTSPICSEITCPSINFTNGQMVLSNGYRAGSHTRFTCDSDEGFFLIGESQLLCQYDGTWSGPIPLCSAQICSKPPNIPNARAERFMETSAGVVIELDCPAPYVMTGEPFFTCLTNGSWLGNMTCELQITCPRLSAPWNGQVKVTVYGGHISAIYSCNEHYVVRGKSHRLCTSHDEWTGAMPSCYRVSATCMPPVIEHGRANVEDFRGRNRMATYECDNGYVLTGQRERFCESVMGEWSGDEPICDPTCDEPEEIENGYTTRVEQKLIYYCNDGYYLQGSNVRFCNDDLTWTQNAPVCKAKAKPTGVHFNSLLAALVIIMTFLL